MLAGRALRPRPTRQCRLYGTHRNGPQSISILGSSDVETFRQQAFVQAIPALLPRQSFKDVPAISQWFTSDSNSGLLLLNRKYLARFGSVTVPLEITNNDQFSRIEHSLSFFLECVHASTSTFETRPSRYFSSYVPGARAIRRTRGSNDFFTSASTLSPPTARVYLAQASITDLPQKLQEDVPTPELVLKAGKGDVYDSSIWLGQAPTYTPLHRDPNPNLFVQLAGSKLVRLFRPEVGGAIFAKVQEKIGGSASATMRGEEMMQGAEKKVLEEEVWDNDNSMSWEAELGPGDGMFIPKAWWHSVKGVGEGMNGSVNWWFR